MYTAYMIDFMGSQKRYEQLNIHVAVQVISTGASKQSKRMLLGPSEQKCFQKEGLMQKSARCFHADV